MPKDNVKPISLSMTRGAKPVKSFSKDAPEHSPKRIVINKVSKELIARVGRLESGPKEIIVKVETPVRPRIHSISIEYDSFGAPKNLIPTYED